MAKPDIIFSLGPYIPYGLFQTKGQMSAKFGSDWFRNVNLYKVQRKKERKKETNLSFIYKMMMTGIKLRLLKSQ
jgi:hypothetical protein